MCKDISRDDNVLVWQYIDFKAVIKYIDNLKSGIYKAFCSKTQRAYRQFAWLNSSLVMTLALKNALLITDLCLSSFETGYLIFCLHSAIDSDIDFFSCYRQALDIKLNCKVQTCVDRIKYLMVTSLIDVYTKYLLQVASMPRHQFCDLSAIFSTCGSISFVNKFVLRIDTKYLIGSLNLSTFLTKLNLVKPIKAYLLEFLNRNAASAMSFYVDTSLSYLAIQKNPAGFTGQLLILWMLQVCYEALVMTNSFFYFGKPFVKSLIFVYDFSSLLILSSDPFLLEICQKKLLSFLSFSGKFQSTKEVLILSLHQGIHVNRVFASIDSRFYPFCFVVKPSLYAQFILMKRVSSLLLHSKAQPLFVVIIRFNMLMLFWSSNYIGQPVKKIFCLIDYLVALKFNLFLRRRKLALMSSKIRMLSSYLEDSSFLKIFKTFFVTVANDAKYYKYYAVAKLVGLCECK